LTGFIGTVMKSVRAPVMIVGGLATALLGCYLISWTTAAYFRLITVPIGGDGIASAHQRDVWGFLGFASFGRSWLSWFFLLIIPGSSSSSGSTSRFHLSSG